MSLQVNRMRHCFQVVVLALSLFESSQHRYQLLLKLGPIWIKQKFNLDNTVTYTRKSCIRKSYRYRHTLCLKQVSSSAIL